MHIVPLLTILCPLVRCGNYVHIPPNWLCYVAPEIMRALNIGNPANELPFTPESDVFAFGTVWYELLTCEYPFRGLPTETLVYLVGTGIKPPLKLQCPRDFKLTLVRFDNIFNMAIICIELDTAVNLLLFVIPWHFLQEVMRQCWSYHPQDRPEFTALVKQLDRLPKLHRSPSYPTKPHSAFAIVSSSGASASSNAASGTTSSIVGGGGGGGSGVGGGEARISGNRLILPLLLVP
ncbi:unnamed protein product [Hydatigera taeniaeformis]|uniref:Protein kinase domain-containing protein n=1 Tax=Hydatigena taeniaeformis TaxID=6205 RepID=A0A0R3X3A7_HYDTA|nr:unnamed protein product [Hydatigera taeniaeformis]